MPILSEAIFRFNTVLNEIPTLFTEVVTIILKFVWKRKRPWITRQILNKSWTTTKMNGDIMVPDLKTWYGCIITKENCVDIKPRFIIPSLKLILMKSLVCAIYCAILLKTINKSKSYNLFYRFYRLKIKGKSLLK